jgi:hypothetical protein
MKFFQQSRTEQKQRVDRFMQEISKDTGLTVLVDSSLGQKIVATPEVSITRDNLEEQLALLVAKLPKGAIWTRLYLPAPSLPNRPYRGDALATYVRAQAGLSGRPLRSSVPREETIEILGKRMPLAEAQAAIKSLGLSPYYVISNPNAVGRGGSEAGSDVADQIGGATSNVMKDLMKQLGVNNPKDIPTGNYRVPITKPDGSMGSAHVSVENDGSGKVKIGIHIADSSDIPPFP